MAKGRLIIKEASYSKQIWVQMDEFAALIFYAAIPHLESDGTLPRDPERLKLTVCPFSSQPTEWFEKAIKTWLATTPAVVIEGTIKGNPTLYFTDFIRSQMGLTHAKPPIFDNEANSAASFSRNSSVSRKAIEVNRSEVNRSEKKKNTTAGRFTPPDISQVLEYCKQRNNGVDAQRFIDFYASKGWLIGKNKMKDWRAAVRTWEKPKAENKLPPGYREEDVCQK